MMSGRIKSLLVAVFSLFIASFFNTISAQPHEPAKQHVGGGEEPNEEKGFNASEVIFGHVLNSHEFHFLDIGDKHEPVHPRPEPAHFFSRFSSVYPASRRS